MTTLLAWGIQPSQLKYNLLTIQNDGNCPIGATNNESGGDFRVQKRAADESDLSNISLILAESKMNLSAKKSSRRPSRLRSSACDCVYNRPLKVLTNSVGFFCSAFWLYFTTASTCARNSFTPMSGMPFVWSLGVGSHRVVISMNPLAISKSTE